MSWIDKEQKRRAAESKRAAPRESAAVSASSRINELWDKIERANAALPSDLQLRAEQGDVALTSPNGALFVAWLRAPNGAALGFAPDGIRYVWPETGRRWSNNFWIHWNVERKRYSVSRRVGTLAAASTATYTFDDTRIDYIIKRLVTGKRVRVRAVRKKILGLF